VSISLTALEFREEKPAVKVKNVGKGEGVLRTYAEGLRQRGKKEVDD
jgi:hypothetical protein